MSVLDPIMHQSAVVKVGRFLLAIANAPRYILASALTVWVLGSIAYALAESASIKDGLWWGVVTGFTVGYGDLYPETFTGRLVAALYMVLMWALLAVISPAALAAKLIVDSNVFSHSEQEQIKADSAQARADSARAVQILEDLNARI